MDEMIKLAQDILRADSEKLIRMANEINSDLDQFCPDNYAPDKSRVRKLQRNKAHNVNERA